MDNQKQQVIIQVETSEIMSCEILNLKAFQFDILIEGQAEEIELIAQANRQTIALSGKKKITVSPFFADMTVSEIVIRLIDQNREIIASKTIALPVNDNRPEYSQLNEGLYFDEEGVVSFYQLEFIPTLTLAQRIELYFKTKNAAIITYAALMKGGVVRFCLYQDYPLDFEDPTMADFPAEYAYNVENDTFVDPETGEAVFVEKVYFVVTNWNAGPGVEGAKVDVYESGTQILIGTAETNAFGAAEVPVVRNVEKMDVKVTKQGHARSLVQGLKPEAANNIPFGILLMTAQLNADPTTETDPIVAVSLFEIEAAGNASRDATPINMADPITGPFTAKVEVTADNHVNSIYEPLIDRIAGAGLVTTDRLYAGEVTEAEFDISPTGHDGEVALYTTVYDKNNNRVLKVDYLTIEGTDPGEVTMYQPMTFADFSSWFWFDQFALENIWTYTRRSGISLYNESRGITEVEKQAEKTFPSKQIETGHVRSMDNQSRMAPEGGNLWTHLYLADWTTVNAYYNTYPGELPNPGDAPDGYNLYWSLDGEHYDKFGFVTEAFLAWLADNWLYFINMGYSEDFIFNFFGPSYKDPSIFLHPGVEMHYQVTSVYGTLESTPTYLGSVVPLDSFNIELENPAPEAVNVTRNPTFQWRPTNLLTSTEGDVVYNYGLFVYDWIQADNGLIIPTFEGGMVEFEDTTGDSIEVAFSGQNNNDWGLNWSWFSPYADTIAPYIADSLEPNKTYGWGINIAYAYVQDADSRAYSIAADFKYRDTSWDYDPAVCMEPDLHADFTTGAQ